MVLRHAILAAAALLAGAGCHAGLSGNAARQDPPVPKETVTVKRFIALHNRNAAAVRSLTAQPRIEVSGEGRRGRVNGLMAMERPRGFRLELRGTGVGQVADLGSNDQEFWFWVKDNKDKAIYVCDYKDVAASQLAVTYQPDWVIEAMGLREIDPREAATISAKPGDKPGLLVLTQARPDNHGKILKKETIVDESTGHIREHRLYARDDLLARATISQYSDNILDPTEENPSGSTIQLPQKFRLEWVAEKLALDITMAGVKVNPKFATEKRIALFSEPTISGIDRLDLARQTPPPAASSNIYESMPSPRSSVRLGQPEPVPLGVEGGIRSRAEPQPLSADLSHTPAQPAGVVGAPIPRGADPEAVRASVSRHSWRPAALARW